jgi:Protein of unknown function (DUF1573)
MRRRNGATVVLAAACVVALAATPARAAGWADALFSERGHDFGPVPRGAIVRYGFTLTNRLSEPLTILNVRASCGCTTGWASTALVRPGESATVEAQMDTRNFVGRKETVLYVTLGTTSGRQGEARLGVGSTILSDVVLNPGSINFGLVSRGQTPSLALSIDRLGNAQWRVLRMVSGSRASDASLVETQRTVQGVSYRLTVMLKPDAPAGLLRDEIRIITNDPESPIIPVTVSASVRGDLTASPSLLSLGVVASTAGAQGRFLVRASRPFTVRGIEGMGEGFKATADDATAKAVHVVTVSYHPEEGSMRGDLQRVFRVHSDLPGEAPVELTVTLHVNP